VTVSRAASGEPRPDGREVFLCRLSFDSLLTILTFNQIECGDFFIFFSQPVCFPLTKGMYLSPRRYVSRLKGVCLPASRGVSLGIKGYVSRLSGVCLLLIRGMFLGSMGYVPRLKRVCIPAQGGMFHGH